MDLVKKAAAVVLISLMMSSCAESGQREFTVTETVSESSVVSAYTEPITAEEITETAEERTETETESAEFEDEAVSEKYEFDRSFVYDSLYCQDSELYINKPMFVGEPENTDAEVYVMFTDDIWVHYDAFWGDTFESDNIVIIRHGDVTDIIPAVWIERFGEAFKLYSGDYDGDGEIEIAAVRYDTGGTMCMINELTVFKKTDGHYKSFVLDYSQHSDIMSDEFTAYIDDQKGRITFKMHDTEFVYDISERFPNGAAMAGFLDYIDYTVMGNDITVTYDVFIKQSDDFMPEPCLNVVHRVEFKDGEFILSDAQFIEME